MSATRRTPQPCPSPTLIAIRSLASAPGTHRRHRHAGVAVPPSATRHVARPASCVTISCRLRSGGCSRPTSPSTGTARCGRNSTAKASSWRAARCSGTDPLIHRSDRGGQDLAIRCTERLAEAGVELSGGSLGDSYNNALADAVIAVLKTEVIRRRGPWRTIDFVEFGVLEWANWSNHRRLLEPIGMIPPAEHEAAYYRKHATPTDLVGANESRRAPTRRSSNRSGFNDC